MICPVTPADLLTFHAVMMLAGMDPRSAWHSTTVDDLAQTLFGPAAGGFLAWTKAGQGAEREALGCVGYRPDLSNPHTLTLNKLATRPTARGMGTGQALVRAVEQHAKQLGYRRVLLAVSQVNLGAVPFYERLGYVQVDEPYTFSSGKNGRPVVLVKAVENTL